MELVKRTGGQVLSESPEHYHNSTALDPSHECETLGRFWEAGENLGEPRSSPCGRGEETQDSTVTCLSLIYTILPKVLGHPSKSLNSGVALGPLVPVKGTPNASAYQDILDNFMLPTLCEQFGDDPFLFQHDCTPVHKARFRPGSSSLTQLLICIHPMAVSLSLILTIAFNFYSLFCCLSPINNDINCTSLSPCLLSRNRRPDRTTWTQAAAHQIRSAIWSRPCGRLSPCFQFPRRHHPLPLLQTPSPLPQRRCASVPWPNQRPTLARRRIATGSSCFPDCFPDLPVPHSLLLTPLPVQATSIESPSVNQPLEIPTCYAPFSDVFCPKRASKLPPHRPWDCAIDLLPGEPVPRGRIYPLSIPEEKAMEEYIKEALDQGYIRPSTSPAASSFFFVAKKDGGLRPCIDYRALNRITVKFRYPLPLVPSALEHLRGATIFTKLDLHSAYNLIWIREGDEWKTAFITPTGHYEYLVMPYGLANAPSVFQDFIHEVLREFLHRFVLVYIDDILIYSRNLAEHCQHVAKVLERLRKFQLFLKAEKCSFHQTSVQFLGYKINSSGIQMDEGKITAIRDWPTPITVKELQRFLGFANFYRRFIQNYISIANPLTSLLRNKPKSLAWSPATEEAFNLLKKAFTTAPLLVHPDPNKPFIVEVDASTTGVGAVLSQQQGNPSRLHPCAFFSRKLSPAERNYDIRNRELLAVKLALEEWRHWLEGAKHPFTVLTDHKNLEYLRAAKRLNPRQARWALFFTRFNVTISYRPGSKNTKVDTLSRMFAPKESPETPEPILPENIIVNPITWSEETLPPADASTNTPPGCPPGSQYIPRARRTALIHSAHTSLGTGHPGIHKTLSLLKDRFWWPNMTADVRRYVQGCKGCAMSKDPCHLPAGKLLSLPVPSRPWSHLGVDFVTNLPTSRNHTCVFMVVDRFSKSCRLLPLKGPPTALETAELIFNHVFRYFGIPEDIVSDRGPQFVSRVWRVFLTRLGVAVSLSSGYHPQTNGQTERKIQEISRYLHTFCHSHQNSWSQYLGWAEYAQNSLRQPSTGLTPFKCVLGYQPPLFPWSGEPSNVPAVDHWFCESERVWDSAHHQLQRALHRHRRTANLWRFDTPAFRPGQKVWLSTRDIRLRLPCRKLSPRFIGPFTILKQINPGTYKLQLPPGYCIHPTFHVSLLKPHYPSVSPSTEPGDGAAEPPLPFLLDDGTTYEVKEILDSQRHGGQLEYLVDWEGYGPEERSWVARDDILDPNLLEALHAAHSHRPAPCARGRLPRRRGPRPSGVGRREGGRAPLYECQVSVRGSMPGRLSRDLAACIAGDFPLASSDPAWQCLLATHLRLVVQVPLLLKRRSSLDHGVRRCS
ncbi:hypothetical protein QTP70_007228 [Hemibagrus guttatus]|uniref:Gypsy retrotransposon integrase-like protein 1 n=1 Tax=Hemibagrus guttatus TaxID=175788 RepID=A0AAE0Q011_9TELE|nr:hypothetical protein QTP70_007228 [Hemibagrus guttatus]